MDRQDRRCEPGFSQLPPPPPPITTASTIPMTPGPATTASCPIPSSLPCTSQGSATSLSLLPEQYSIEATGETKSPTPKSKNTILIERLARKVVEHIAKHDFTHLDYLQYLDPDYTAYVEYRSDEPHIKGREAYLESFQAFVKTHPCYGLEVESLHVEVDEKNGTAVVWMLLGVTGVPKGIQRQSVTLQHWKRGDGAWRAYKQTGGKCRHLDLMAETTLISTSWKRRYEPTAGHALGTCTYSLMQ